MSKLFSFVMFLVLLFCFLCIGSCIHINGNCRCNLNSEHKRDVELETDMADGMTLSVETSHSHIYVSGTDEKQCYVKANIRVRAENAEKAREIAEKVKVDFKKFGEHVIIVVVKPQVEEKYGVYVSYDVRAPRKTNVVLKTSHGPIECHNLDGNVTASTTHDPVRCSNIRGNLRITTSHDPIECSNIVGDLKLRTTHDPIKLSHITGSVEANTTHDPIEAEYVSGRMDLRTSHGRVLCREIDSKQLHIQTSHDNVNISFKSGVQGEIDANVNTSHGNIKFDLPIDFNGEIFMSTTHGKIKSDVPIIVKGEISEENISGKIGEGAGKVSLKTKHGSILLK